MNGTYTKMVNLTDVDPNPDNYNEHDADQLANLQDSLREFGYVRRIVVQEQENGRYLLVAGHGVFSAAKLEQFDDLEMTVIPEDWPIERVNAYLVADNEHASQASPNQEKLAAIIQAAHEYDQEMTAAIGITSQHLEQLLSQTKGTAVPDEEPEDAEPDLGPAEELQAKWQVEYGDIWQIGRHFITCGDCRDPETWARLYAAAGIEKVQGVVTSPPYAEQRKDTYGGVPPDKYVEWWEPIADNVMGGLAADGSFFVNIKTHVENGTRHLYVMDLVLAMCREWDWHLIDEFSWVKPGYPGKFEGRFKNGFEPIYHFALSTKPKAPIENVAYESEGVVNATWYPLKHTQGRDAEKRRQDHSSAMPSNVLKLHFDNDRINHPGRFPVALPEFFIQAFSDEGDIWLDIFASSFTTAVAAHKSGRIGLGIEKIPKFVAVGIERMMAATEETPRRL